MKHRLTCFAWIFLLLPALALASGSTTLQIFDDGTPEVCPVLQVTVDSLANCMLSLTGSGDNVTVDGVATSDPDLRSEGDCSLTLCTAAGAPDAACVAAGDVIFRVKADAVALGTDTTGGYAASATEGGPATTATALAANGANCSAGSFPIGVDASGAAEGCADAGTQTELDAVAAAALPLAGGTMTGAITLDETGLIAGTGAKPTCDAAGEHWQVFDTVAKVWCVCEDGVERCGFASTGGDVTGVMGCASGDCGDIPAGSGDSLNFSGVNPDVAGEGILLPNATTCGGTPSNMSVCVNTGTSPRKLCVANAVGAYECITIQPPSVEANNLDAASEGAIADGVPIGVAADTATWYLLPTCNETTEKLHYGGWAAGFTCEADATAATGTLDPDDLSPCDTNDDNLIDEGCLASVGSSIPAMCKTIENLSGDDDDLPLWSVPTATNLVTGYCQCIGTCTTPATVTFERDDGTPATIAGGTATCTSRASGDPTPVTFSGGEASFGTYDVLRMDTTNTPTTGDTYLVCWTW